MIRKILRVHCCVALLGLAFAITATTASAAPEEPTLTLAVPVSAGLGDALDLKARLTDASGAPIANVAIVFTLPSTFFLGTMSDVVVARANTDKAGWAETQFRVQNDGPFNVRAEFRGNERYASAKVSLPVALEDAPRQLYVQEAGVRIPALGSPPELGPTAGYEHEAASSGLASLWPMMSFWPIGLAVAIVWSLYAFVVVQIFRIVASASGENAQERLRGRSDPFQPFSDRHR